MMSAPLTRLRMKTPDPARQNAVKSPHPKRLKKAQKAQELAAKQGILKVATPQGKLTRRLSFQEAPKVTVIEAENRRPTSKSKVRAVQMSEEEAGKILARAAEEVGA